MSRKFLPSHAPGHAAIAPSAIESESSGTIEDSVGSRSTPAPWQRGQAPSGVFGEKKSEVRRPPWRLLWGAGPRSRTSAGCSPAREYSRRIALERFVVVPTVERAPPTVVRCSRATVGGIPVTDSTRGSTALPISRRAKGATDSR
ncbi:hypothetical protein [Brachybacterium sp. AOP3-A1-3]|uniref:hypothetical protein n=1 Tax=Brachybacterium sp. AOP3-A1-3 TaxID=3457699 RepID=UPI0040332274